MNEYELIECSNALEIPSKEFRVCEKNKLYISDCLIPYTHTHATRVFFLTDDDGNEYGQFPTFSKAYAEARKILAERGDQ